MTLINNNRQNFSPELKALRGNDFFCVAIGSSAGGFEALKELLANLPDGVDNFSVILSQSLENLQFSTLESLLSANTLLHMCRPAEGADLKPGCIYAAMPESSMRLVENKLNIQQGKQAGDSFLADALFLSVAVSASEKSIAVILSGTGHDGSAGVKSIKAAGGTVLVQRPETSKYDGMPRAAIATTCADNVSDPAELGRSIGNIIKQQSLPLKDNTGEITTAILQQAKIMAAPALLIESMVKETLYAGYQHTYIVTDKHCNILSINGDSTIFLTVVNGHLPCNLFSVLQNELHTEVKKGLANVLGHNTSNYGNLEIFSLKNETVFIRVIVKKVQNENEPEELFVIIFENLNPHSLRQQLSAIPVN